MNLADRFAVPSGSDPHAEARLEATLPYARDEPSNSGRIKVDAEDFVVDEVLGFPLSGDGEHSYVCIEKRGENTEYLARLLARFAGVPLVNVGYAGLKDRHACSRQWFSIGLAGRVEPDWTELNSATVRLIETRRHRRKLKRGDLAGNQFRITVRSLAGSTGLLEERLSRIASCGVPNYFGPQRFGRNGGNLAEARAMLLGGSKVTSRHRRSLYLSAARSYLFNRILARRVEHDCWNRPLPGDAFMSGPGDRPTNRMPDTEDLFERVATLAIHPAGSLWGCGEALCSGEALRLEQDALADCRDLCDALEGIGLQRGMRPLRLAVTDLDWQFSDHCTLRLEFFLASGGYATSVLRELIRSAGST